MAQLTSAEARERLLAELPGSAVFGAQFRMNAARALLLPRERVGKRTPLWLSRLRAKDLLQAVAQFDDFPILLETYRDCLRDVMDLDGLTEVLDRIQAGEIGITVRESEVPSPVAIGAGLPHGHAVRLRVRRPPGGEAAGRPLPQSLPPGRPAAGRDAGRRAQAGRRGRGDGPRLAHRPRAAGPQRRGAGAAAVRAGRPLGRGDRGPLPGGGWGVGRKAGWPGRARGGQPTGSGRATWPPAGGSCPE